MIIPIINIKKTVKIILINAEILKNPVDLILKKIVILNRYFNGRKI